MSYDHNFTLIKGEFTLADGREVLMNLINRKIKFHNLKIIQNFEKKGVKDLESQNRIRELEKTRREILNLLKSNDQKDITLNINSVIYVSIQK